MGLVVLLGEWLDAFFKEDLATYAAVGAATALVFSVHNHVRGCATARFATRRVASASALGTVVTLVSTVMLLREGWGITGVLLGSAAGMLIAALFMLPSVIARESGGALEAGVSQAGDTRGIRLLERRFLTYALPFGGIALLNYVVHSQTEVFFLARFHGPESAGFFQLGFLFSQRLVDFLPLALWEVSMAGFSRIAVRHPERLPDALHGYLTLLYLVIAPVACLGVAFSVSAIRMLYTDAYLPAAIVSQAYFCMAAFAAFGAPVGMIVYARERVGGALRAYALFALVNVGLDLLLIPRLSLWGAILGLGLAKLLAVLLMARLAWEEVPDLRVPWGVIAKAFAASSPVLLWMLVQDRWTQPWQIVLGGIAALLLVLVTYRGLGVIGARERDLIAGTRLPLRRELLAILAPKRKEEAPV
jgi:O-antigen/teichoic acid export membrane protein